MIGLVKALENIRLGQETVIKFGNNNVLGLKDFERVDESIYQRSDLITADVVSQIRCNRNFSKPGTSLQFSVNDIMEIDGMKVDEWLNSISST